MKKPACEKCGYLVCSHTPEARERVESIRDTLSVGLLDATVRAASAGDIGGVIVGLGLSLAARTLEQPKLVRAIRTGQRRKLRRPPKKGKK